MYHSHHDEMTQMALGMMGMFVIHPRKPSAGYKRRPRLRDHAQRVEAIPCGRQAPQPERDDGLQRPHMNAKCFPGTDAAGREARAIACGCASATSRAMDHHPSTCTGYYFKVVATDGGADPGDGAVAGDDGPGPCRQHAGRRVPRGRARRLGDALPHDPPRDEPDGPRVPEHDRRRTNDLDDKVRKLVPGYMTMGQHGMGDMADMGWRCRRTASRWPVGQGPSTHHDGRHVHRSIKVREDLKTYDKDPGWYKHPPGTLARLATADELTKDGIKS
jgi:hypothetical protein